MDFLQEGGRIRCDRTRRLLDLGRMDALARWDRKTELHTSRRFSKARMIIETTLGQLVGRFHIERTWARDLWLLSHRVIRKVLGYTVAVWINRNLGRDPLDLAGLVSS